MRAFATRLAATCGLIAAASLSGCRGCEAGHPGAGASSSASAGPKRPPPPPVLKPLVADANIVSLPVPGFGAAVVSVPRGATQPRPLIVVLHGEDDRPEWQCRTWREISGGFPWVLCPRGTARLDSPAAARRFTFESLGATTKELRASLTALKDKYVYYVSPGPVILAGVSLGAQYAALVAKQEPSFFSRVVLVEGGFDQWASGTATLFQRGGGQKVLFACGHPDCVPAAEGRRAMSSRLRIETRVVAAPQRGRDDDGAVAVGLKREYSWLVAGDPRFEPARERQGTVSQ